MTATASEIPAPLTNAGEVLEALLDGARNDRDALEAVGAFLREMDDMAVRARALRDYLALRLREFGVPNTEIGRLAGVTDSYIARRTLKAGADPKITRPPLSQVGDTER